MGAAFVRGIQSQGVGATPKHYAANNQETARGSNDSQVSERALREIYLKAFEITVKASEPLNIMTSYNRINGQYNNMHWQLVTHILRNEWGFDGVVMTDWGGVSGNDESGLAGQAGRIRSGVDILESGSVYASTEFCFMPGFCFSMPGLDEITDSILGTTNPPLAPDVRPLKLAELRTSVERLMDVTLKSERFRTAHRLPTYSAASGEYEPAYRAFTVSQPAQSKAIADMIYVNGKALSGFTPNNLDYSVFTTQWSALPAVSAIGPANVTLQVSQASAARPVATVYVRAADGAESRYRVVFTDTASRPVFHPADISADLSGITIDGRELPTFYRATYDYTVWSPAGADSVVGAIAPEGVAYTTSKEGDLVTIRSESATQAREYRVLLGQIDPARLPRSDDFASGTVDPSVWTIGGRTEALTVQPGALVVESEDSGWAKTDSADLKNYISQAAEGNWTAEVEIGYDTLPAQPGAAIGLMVYDTLDTYVKVELNGHTSVAANTTAQDGTRFYVRNSLTGSPHSNTAAGVNTWGFDWVTWQPALLNPMEATNSRFWLRIAKAGEDYTFAFKTATGQWTSIGATQSAPMAHPKIALYATNDPGAEPVTATFGPFTVQDASPPAFPTAATTSISQVTSTRVYADTRFAQRGSFSPTNDPQAVGHLHFDGGEFNNALYNIDVARAGYYSISPRVTSSVGTNSKWTFFVQVDGEDWASWGQAGGTPTAGDPPAPTWVDLAPKVVYLTPGLHKLRLHCWTTTGFNLSAFTVAPSAIDRDALLAAIVEAEAAPSARYTAASWKALTAVLKTAKVVFEDATAGQADVTAAAGSLAGAIDALVLKPPTTPGIVVPPAVAYAGGVSQFGATATASAGAWSAAPDEMAFQWLRNGEPIAGATDSAYVPGVDDVGTKLSCRLTVSVAGQEDGVFTTEPVLVAAAAAPKPVKAPAFSGAPTVGQPINVTAGQWSPTPDSVTYRWTVGGVELAGQASATYTPTAADAGKTIAVIVTARRIGHEVGTLELTTPAVAAEPSPTPTITVPGPDRTVAPVVPAVNGQPLGFAGSLGKGTLLNAAALVPAGASATYQWVRSGVAISGATGPTYTVQTADAGQRVHAVLVVTAADGTVAAIESAAVTVPKLAATVKAKLVKASVKAKAAAKVAVTVKVPGVKAPTGKIAVKYGAKTKIYTLNAAKKGVVTLKLPKIAKKGSYAIKVTYRGTSQIAKRTAKTVTLRVN
jgi:hypothetical protein